MKTLAALLIVASLAFGVRGNRDTGPPSVRHGRASAIGSDFNGDGFADVAFSVPYEDVGDVLNAGAVNVVYGSATGLTAAGNQFWSQDSPGILDQAEAGDQFSRSIATADFNGDGYDDMAVGVAFEDVGSVIDAGAVNVIYGAPNGLRAAGNQFWSQDSPGILDQAERDDQFGRVVVAGDFNGDGFADLAVAVRYEDVGDVVNAGAVNILFGSATGLTDAGNQFWNQDSTGILDDAETDDRFGFSEQAGDLNGDGFADLAVGVAFEDVGDITDAGGANVLYGSAAGLTADGNQFWTQDSPGILDQAEARDGFGRAVTTGDFNADGFADLAVGVRDEDLDSVIDAGAANVIYGSASGLTDVGNQFWTQDSPNVLDQAESDDRFARSLDTGDFNGDGFADLAVGVRDEDLEGQRITIKDAGAANVLYGSAAGLSADGNQFWTQDSPGVRDKAETDDRFSTALSTGDFNTDGFDELVVGVRHEDVGDIVDAGIANALYGTASGLSATGNQLWSQDTFGVKDEAEAGDMFSGVSEA